MTRFLVLAAFLGLGIMAFSVVTTILAYLLAFGAIGLLLWAGFYLFSKKYPT